MNRRWAQVAVSFLIVAAVYQLYARLAVPMIEPEPENIGVSDHLAAPSEQVLQERLDELTRLFPGRREFLKKSKIFEIDQSTLIFQDYFNLGDGRILVRPCLMVLRQPETPETRTDRQIPETLVLEAGEGAIFQFDRPLDLRSAKVGRFLSGQLLGSIILRGQGPRQDFRLTTRDVTLTEHRVWTNHPVEFLWGRHRGRGSGLEIVFQGRSPFSVSTPEVSPFRIQRFLLRHVDRLHFDMSAFVPSLGAEKLAKSGGNSSEQDEHALEIACQGPLLFVPGQRMITFEDRVEVTRLQGSQTLLRVNCDRLSLLLKETRSPTEKADPLPAEKVTTAQPASVATPISLKLLQAVGQPVTISLPTWKAESSCEDLRFDVEQGLLSMEGPQGVTVKQGTNQLRSPRIQCQMDRDGKIRTIAAAGPGEARSQVSETTPVAATVSWESGFFWTLQDQERLISLQGNVKVAAESIGSVECGRLWCWLEDTSDNSSSLSGLRPQRVVAQDRVRIESPQIRADTERLESWFVWPTTEAPPDRGDRSSQGLSFGKENVQKKAGRDNALSQLQVAARLLRVEFRIVENRGQLSALSADGIVKVQETPKEPGAEPLQIFGEHLEIIEASSPQAIFALTGNPAFVAGRGLSLSGFQVFLDRGRNLVSTSGPGRVQVNQLGQKNDLMLPVSGEKVDIQWSQGMDFDGQTVTFKGNAVLISGNRRIQAETLEVQIAPPVSLTDLNTAQRIQLQTARAIGQVLIENVEVNLRGEIQSRDRLFVSEIAVNWATGAITAPGFGRFLTVRSAVSPAGSSLNPLESGQARDATVGGAANPTNDGSSSPPTQPIALEISYSQGLAGNVHQRTITCRGRINARYGSVDRWDIAQLPDDPALLGARGLMLHSDEIAVYQMITPGMTEPHLELEARGNVTVEGQSHTARARRLAFDESKTLLTLEGDGDVPAELYRQEFSGGPVQKTAARRIYYWYNTKTVKVDDPKSLEVSQLPAQPSNR